MRDGAALATPRRHGRWYVVITKPRQEAVAERDIRLLGFETFLPLERYTRRKDRAGHRLHHCTRALFPMYLFVRLDLELPWLRVKYAKGVAGMIDDADGLPVAVERGAVEALKLAHQRGGGFIVKRPNVAPGDSVEVPEGLLEGLPATVQALQICGGEVVVKLIVDAGIGPALVSLPATAF